MLQVALEIPPNLPYRQGRFAIIPSDRWQLGAEEMVHGFAGYTEGPWFYFAFISPFGPQVVSTLLLLSDEISTLASYAILAISQCLAGVAFVINPIIYLFQNKTLNRLFERIERGNWSFPYIGLEYSCGYNIKQYSVIVFYFDYQITVNIFVM